MDENCNDTTHKPLKASKHITYAGIIKKIDDIPDLRIELADIFESRSRKEAAKYSLLLGRHILDMTNTEPCNEIIEGFQINQNWQDGKTGGKGFAKFQPARDAAFRLMRLAHDEKEPIKEKIYRIMAQIAAVPHVKNHALIASDYAVKLINSLYPNNLDEVRKERDTQIRLMKSVQINLKAAEV